MNKSIEILCHYAAKNLPDSMAERKTVLRAIEKITIADSAINKSATAQLAAIAAVEKMDAQLKLHFKPGNPGHDGHHNHGAQS